MLPRSRGSESAASPPSRDGRSTSRLAVHHARDLPAPPRTGAEQGTTVSHVWGYGYDPGSNIVEVYVGYLRKKLGARAIETVRGMGYRLPES